MTTTSTTAPAASRVAVLLLAAAALSAAATSIVAFGALALGAEPSFAPLQPPAYLTFAVLGTLAGVGGWVLVARRVRNSARVLRALVPALVLASLIPDVVLLLTGFIPGTSPIGVVVLALMHPIVATVAVLIGRRIAPAS